MMHGAAVGLSGITGKAPRVLANDAAAESAGMGLSEGEIEALYGPGSPGQSFMYYTEPVYDVELHIGYDNDAADYIWLTLGDEQSFTGLALEDARTLAASLLPSDARLRESYASPETPGSIAQLETARYTSRWLDEVLDGRSSILLTILSVPGGNGSGMEALHGMIQVEQRSSLST
jgi:hypothetical protein